MTHRRATLWTACICCLVFSTLSGDCPTLAGEIGWIEEFSLATDRSVPLKQLIPGTEAYYYYNCLNFQNLEQYEKVEELLKAWVARYNWTPGAIEIQNRQALLRYNQDPNQALNLIRQRLGLQFNHQAEQLNQKPNLPTSLDAKLISREALEQNAFNQFPSTIQGFEDVALDWLTTAKLNPDQRRHLLSRLQRPDYPNLVQLVIDDLNHQNSGGFGQFEIHRRLLQKQLDECAKLKPDLLNQQNFVDAYLLRLHPSDDVNWRQNPAELRDYLDRLWAFVKTLAPVHNSLKAHVLYHRLVFDRAQGKFDPDRFQEYITLPKHTVYVAPKYMEAQDRQQFACQLQQDFSRATMLPPVGDDEPLVRSYIQHFLVDADDTKAYTAFINDQFLQHNFAEAKIVNGLGDAEKLYSLLPPEVYKNLKDRIDLDFAETNKTEFNLDDPVSLDLFVKNVDTLIVKVFELNTPSYYRANLHEISTDINLDGLVANEEKTYNYHEATTRRVKRHFEFATLNKRGVYVIDFIGNGKASRAVVRKGKLRFLTRTGLAGQTFTVFDEQNKLVPTATVWLGGTLYTPDKEGTVTVPFSNQPGRQPIVISLGSFASLGEFQQESEEYHLSAAMYVDREELIGRRKAHLVIRPGLLLNNTPVTPKALEEVRLVITSTDLDNVVSTKQVSDLKWLDDRETIYEFQVPQRLQAIHFSLQGRVENLSRHQKVDLSAEQNFAINAIDQTDRTEAIHFSQVGENYVLDLLGKTGEAKPDKPVNLTFKLFDFTQPVHVTLQSNPQGRIVLGKLPGVDSVSASEPQGGGYTWKVRRDEHTYPAALHGEVGKSLVVPYMGQQDKVTREEFSLLELRAEHFLADHFDHLSLKNGLLSIDKLPVGDFDLWLKSSNTHIRLRVTEGRREAGYVLGSFRKLEIRNEQPLQMRPVEVAAETIKVHLENATPLTRVHVIASRYQPAFSAYQNFAAIRGPEPYYLTTVRSESQYVAGRNIGDEYRYIIDRKFATKYPGNLLDRPSLLLNPWAIRTTETGQQVAQGGDEFARRAPGLSEKTAEAATGKISTAQGTGDFCNLDFLANSSLVVANLAPDKDGIIEIKRSELGPHPELLFVAVDPIQTVSRIVALPEVAAPHLDLRLAKELDLQKHYTQQQRISILAAQQSLVISDVTSTRVEAFDTLGKVYSLYTALNDNASLKEFNFVRDWPKLKPDEKKALYLKHASHEMHVFLYKKDPEFFKTAIKPYLANKKEKRFLDHWLLEDDLSEYLKPWNYEQLNTFERVLLSQRVEGERPLAARLVKEQFELLPPNPDRLNHLFQTALKGSSLDTSDPLGMEAQRQLRDATTKIIVQEESAEKLLGNATGADPGLNAGTLQLTAPRAAAAPAGPPAENKPGQGGGGFGGRGLARGDKKDESRKEADAKSERELEFLSDDRAKRKEMKQYYRKLDKTMEYVESNYYKLPLDAQNAGLITASAFWRDYAAAEGDKPFFSTNLADASRNFPEMLAGLSLLDLPFTSAEHKTEYKDTQMTLTAGSPMVVYHEEIQPAAKVAEHAPILVSENFYRQGDQYRQVNGEQVDKFVTEEFLVDVVYGCHIVVTNPTSTKKKVDVLLQVPAGAMPVAKGQYTRSVHLDLEPYHTQTLDYQFYFPLSGKFNHYPVQVAGNGEILAFAAPFMFNVVRQLTNVDKESWDYISQHGSVDDVLNYLKQQNVLKVNLDRIAWRMHDKAFFQTVTTLLASRHIYNNTLWSYGIQHNDPATVRQFLQFAGNFTNQCGEWLDSPLLKLDPIVRSTFEQMEYKPLVNARVGRLGRNREILNDRFMAQYQRLLKILSYRRELNPDELLAVTYYLLLQDRVEEAIEFFGRVNREQTAEKLQYDYCAAYLHFSKGEPQLAQKIAEQYAKYPVDRWRLMFTNILNQVQEIEKHDVKVADAEDRTQLQASQAASTPTLDFTVESKQIKMEFHNLKTVTINYYLMDIELLFSRNPFVQGESKQFSYIQPNETQTVKLPGQGNKFEMALPAKLANSNVLVEIVGDGVAKTQAYYSNALRAQMVENYGQVRVTQEKDGSPLAKVYCKVYAKMQDGSVKFYKDGYTDLRGVFDYTSLSTNELDFVQQFSVLILSEQHGAVVREAKPPKR